MKIFVTGADGFIGSHLVEHLRNRGHAVAAMAMIRAEDSYGWLDDVTGVYKVRGDIRDARQISRLIDESKAEVVFHLAAMGSVPYSYQAPQSVFETNVMGTMNVAEACLDHGAKLIHTSTSEVYGTALETPQTESHTLQAQSPYAASKIAADKIVESYVCSYDLPAVTIRPFNTYGPRQSQRAVIPRLINEFYSKKPHMTMGNGTTFRDFLYVTDTVRAFEAALSLENFNTYNVSSGESVSILDVAQQISDGQKLIRTNAEARMRPRDSEVYELRGDSTAFRGMTGWKPLVPLEEGLNLTKAWWAKRKDERGTFV